MTLPGTVGGDDRIRLFVALELPVDAVEALVSWGKEHLTGGRPVTSFHITLAFLGSRSRSTLEPIVDVLRRESAATEPFLLEPVRYRETRSVGMLVLDDPSGRASALAERVQVGLEQPRGVRARAPHMAAARHRSALPRAPATRSVVTSPRPVRSVRCRCFAVTPVPVRGEVRGTGDMCTGRELRTTRRG